MDMFNGRGAITLVTLGALFFWGCGNSADGESSTDQGTGSDLILEMQPTETGAESNGTDSGSSSTTSLGESTDSKPNTGPDSATNNAMAAIDPPTPMNGAEDGQANAMNGDSSDVEMPTDDAVNDENDVRDTVNRPNFPMGPMDVVARRGCALLDLALQDLEVVDTEGDAGQILLTPQPETAYSIKLPASGVGYVTLEVPDWAITIAAFSHFEQTATILDPDGVTEEIIPLSWNGACPDTGLTDHRIKYHSWGSFTVKLEGEPDSLMTLSFIKQN